MNKVIFHSLLICLLLPVITRADESFDKALRAARQQDYSSALELFDSIVHKEPANISAIINSGNCYFQLEKFGKAIHRFESALKFSPGDITIVRSIEACHAALGKQEAYDPAFGAFETLLFKIGSSTWAILSIIFALLLSVAVFLKLIAVGNIFLRSFSFIVICGLALSGCIIAGMQVHGYLKNVRFAIVTSSATPLLLNEQGELSGLHLTQGTRVLIISSKDQHLAIQDQNKQSYFVRKTDVRLF